ALGLELTVALTLALVAQRRRTRRLAARQALTATALRATTALCTVYPKGHFAGLYRDRAPIFKCVKSMVIVGVRASRSKSVSAMNPQIAPMRISTLATILPAAAGPISCDGLGGSSATLQQSQPSGRNENQPTTRQKRGRERLIQEQPPAHDGDDRNSQRQHRAQLQRGVLVATREVDVTKEREDARQGKKQPALVITPGKRPLVLHGI